MLRPVYLPGHPLACTALRSDQHQEMRRSLHHSGERGFYPASIRAVNRNIRTAAVELEIEIRVGIPCLEQPLIGDVLGVVIANKYFRFCHIYYKIIDYFIAMQWGGAPVVADKPRCSLHIKPFILVGEVLTAITMSGPVIVRGIQVGYNVEECKPLAFFRVFGKYYPNALVKSCAL